MMPLLLAADVPDLAVGGGVVAAIAWMISQHFLFRKYIREAAGVKDTHQVDLKGQPIRVSQETKYVTSEQLEAVNRSIEALKEDVDKVDESVRKTKDALQLEGSRRAGQINGRVDGLAKEVTEAKTAVEYTGNQVNRVEAKVDRLLGRLKA